MTTVPICRKIVAENLDCTLQDFCSVTEAAKLFDKTENCIEYNTGRLAQVRIFGKLIDIPRKQAAYGDDGLTYTFSGTTVPAKPWIPLLQRIRERVETATGNDYNFVLINRYKDGEDYIGEHRDDEIDLQPTSSIASLSLGQSRDFIFKHRDSRGPNAKRNIPPVKVLLHSGSLLVMNYPTNVFWYHSLPKRRNATGPRINFTFREMRNS